MTLSVLSDSYRGLDQEIMLSYKLKNLNDVIRVIFNLLKLLFLI